MEYVDVRLCDGRVLGESVVRIQCWCMIEVGLIRRLIPLGYDTHSSYLDSAMQRTEGYSCKQMIHLTPEQYESLFLYKPIPAKEKHRVSRIHTEKESPTHFWNALQLRLPNQNSYAI
jgi:hypothetical protein